MKWFLTHSTNQLHYWKMEEDEFPAELKYNDQAKSFRLTSDDKRLFFIERVGFLQSKYLLKTEYSIVIGEVYPVKNWHSGLITIENKKFNYFLQHDTLTLSTKKESFSLSVEISDANKVNPSEFFALLFSSLRLLTTSYAGKKALA